MSSDLQDYGDKNNRRRLPNQRWQIAPPQPDKASELSLSTGLLPLVAQVIINRDMDSAEAAHEYIEPESQDLPSPMDEFEDLWISVELIKNAIRRRGADCYLWRL